jgi:hypothetical protein
MRLLSIGGKDLRDFLGRLVVSQNLVEMELQKRFKGRKGTISNIIQQRLQLNFAEFGSLQRSRDFEDFEINVRVDGTGTDAFYQQS